MLVNTKKLRELLKMAMPGIGERARMDFLLGKVYTQETLSNKASKIEERFMQSDRTRVLEPNATRLKEEIVGLIKTAGFKEGIDAFCKKDEPPENMLTAERHKNDIATAVIMVGGAIEAKLDAILKKMEEMQDAQIRTLGTLNRMELAAKEKAPHGQGAGQK